MSTTSVHGRAGCIVRGEVFAFGFCAGSVLVAMVTNEPRAWSFACACLVTVLVVFVGASRRDHLG